MINLLSAEFVRLYKNAMFEASLILAALLGAASPLTTAIVYLRHPPAPPIVLPSAPPESAAVQNFITQTEDSIHIPFDRFDLFFGMILLMFLFAIWMSLFIGAEYSNKAIKNKVIIGHTRAKIYMSKLLVVIAANILLTLICIGSALLVMKIFGANNELIKSKLFPYIYVIPLAVVAITGIIAFITMICPNKHTGVLISLVVIFALFFSSTGIINVLHTLKFQPDYITKTEENIYQFIHDYTPVSHLLRIIAYDEYEFGNNPHIANIAITALFTVGGGLIFRRKQLK